MRSSVLNHRRAYLTSYTVPVIGSERFRSPSRVLDVRIFQHRERAFSFSIERTRLSDPLSQLLVQTPNSRTLAHNEERTNVQTATVRPAQHTTEHTLIEAYRDRAPAPTASYKPALHAPAPWPITRPARGLLRHSVRQGQSQAPRNHRYRDARISYERQHTESR